ncbi:hypothetical protein ACFQ0M_40155 [Kitasatospora aburaviensis]
MLTTLGLTREAEAVYRLMLSQPDWGVVRIAGSLAWAEAAVRAAMDELADHELIRPSWEGGGAMRTVSPKVAFEALIARRQAEVARKQHEVESSRAAIAGLVAEYSMLRPEEGSGGVEHLTGLDEIRARLEELGAQACRETMSFAPGGKQTPENREASRPITQALLDRGVKVKTVYLSSIRNDPGSVEHANWLAAQGGETRTTSVLPMRMQIVDREVAMVPLDPDDLTKGVAVIRELGAVAGLCALFDQIWEQSEVLGAAPPPRPARSHRSSANCSACSPPASPTRPRPVASGSPPDRAPDDHRPDGPARCPEPLPARSAGHRARPALTARRVRPHGGRRGVARSRPPRRGPGPGGPDPGGSGPGPRRGRLGSHPAQIPDGQGTVVRTGAS